MHVVRVRVHVDMCCCITCTHMHMHIYIYAHVHIYVCIIHTYTYTCTCTCTCAHMHVPYLPARLHVLVWSSCSCMYVCACTAALLCAHAAVRLFCYSCTAAVLVRNPAPAVLVHMRGRLRGVRTPSSRSAMANTSPLPADEQGGRHQRFTAREDRGMIHRSANLRSHLQSGEEWDRWSFNC